MNRLAAETSPYLRQHATNPVDWFPWGPEALERARVLDRPILVSIGYASCHWCHVMAHESFEDDATAEVLNEHFVAIKVDREERPDLDAIYMEALQALTGSGGWPLNVFLTPAGEPFFGGTYFPPTDRGGRPGFATVLRAIASAWGDRRAELERQAAELTEVVERRLSPPADDEPSTPAGTLLEAAVARFAELYDPEHGGIGQAPKFPQAPMLELLLRAAYRGDRRALEMATTTLDAMAAGGIYDQLAGGFARYSVDRYWLVPHFEKMAYDQAVLARCYLDAYQLTGRLDYREVVCETLGFVIDELSDDSGAIFSSLDADDPGGEGHYYTWTRDELVAVLGTERGELAARWYGVDERPNFEHGRSVLRRARRGELVRPAPIEEVRAELLAARRARPGPARDEKVLTEWAAMCAASLARAGAALGEPRFVERAEVATAALLARARRGDGRLLRAYAQGRAAHLGTAGDYAALIDCCTRLSEATGVASHLETATGLAEDLIRLFRAPDGGFFLTGADAEELVVRPVDLYDGVVPSATSAAAAALARLGALVDRRDLVEVARAAGARLSGPLRAGPLAFAHLLQTLLTLEDGPGESVIGGDRRDLLEVVRARYLPESVLAWGEPTESSLWAGRDDDRAYVCRDQVCLAPVGDPDALATELDALARVAR